MATYPKPKNPGQVPFNDLYYDQTVSTVISTPSTGPTGQSAQLAQPGK